MRTRVLRVDARAIDPEAIAEAADVLTRGGMVAFPTETVYGLGGHALDPAAVARIFHAKGRPATDPLIVHLARAEHLRTVARHVPASADDLARAFWPGALTLIVEKQPSVPALVTAGLSTVGVRVPSHPVAQRLIERAGIPVAAPSANRFSHPSPTSAEHVLADLDGLVDVVIDSGPTFIGLESTILDLTVSPPVVRRPGGVSLGDLQRIIPETTTVGESAGQHIAQLAPGQLLRHYAPRATLTLYLGSIEVVAHRVGEEARSLAAAGLRVGVLAPEEDLIALAPRLAAMAATGRIVTGRYGSRRDRHAAARDLFGAMRDLDAADVDVIVASAPDAQDIGLAIIDRLTRAAEGRVVRL